ncbi:hypothetical protein FSP39_016219 [Pinctada imbricata]|uniref:Uncharacterized protein n=1 Tax=Pinctada imbricata TaxID=66713 RepID=A0AA89CC72_PINIB|nr:hypothetical protein FSP39_016219 [Pinctada imbricata]
MSSKLRKSVNEKVQEIKEQREVVVAILDQFISESLTVAERLSAVTDNSLFMQNYVDVMQDLNQCYSICVLLTAEVEERIESFYKAHHGQTLQCEAPLQGCTTALKVNLPSDNCESSSTKDAPSSKTAQSCSDKTPETGDVNKPCTGKTGEGNDVHKVIGISDINKSEYSYSKNVQAGFKDKEINIDAISIVSDTKDSDSGKTTLSLNERYGVTPLVDNAESSTIVADKCDNREGAEDEKSNVLLHLKDQTDIKQQALDSPSIDIVKNDGDFDRVTCLEMDYNINAAGSEKLEHHKKVVTNVSPLETEDKTDNVNVQGLTSEVDDEYRRKECNNFSTISTDNYHCAVGKPKLDIEVAQRFLSNIIRQAEKDRKSAEKRLESTASGVSENIGAKDIHVSVSPDFNIGPDINTSEEIYRESLTERRTDIPHQPTPEYTFRHIENVEKASQVHSNYSETHLQKNLDFAKSSSEEVSKGRNSSTQLQEVQGLATSTCTSEEASVRIPTLDEDRRQTDLSDACCVNVKGEITHVMDRSADSAYHTTEGQITDKSESLSATTNVNEEKSKNGDSQKGTVSEVKSGVVEVEQRSNHPHDGDTKKGTVSAVQHETDEKKQRSDDKSEVSARTNKSIKKEDVGKKTKPPVKEKPKTVVSGKLESSVSSKSGTKEKHGQSESKSGSSSASSNDCNGKVPDTCVSENTLISPLLGEQDNRTAGLKLESVEKSSKETKILPSASKNEENKDKSKELKISEKIEEQKSNKAKYQPNTKEKKDPKPVKDKESVEQAGKCDESVGDNIYGKGPVLEYVTLSPRRVITAIISEACSPWLFYIQEWSSKLTAMMEEVSKYVSTMMSLEAEIVATQHIKVPVEGMVCLAKYSKDGCYYRAKVTKVITKGSDMYVNVTFVDYGNKEKRKLSHLWELPTRFTELPAQAVPCCLAKVAPTNKYGLWTETDINTFSKITLGQTFNMHPVHVSTEPGMPSFVNLFFNIPQIQVVQGKQILVPGPNQVSVHSLLVSKVSYIISKRPIITSAFIFCWSARKAHTGAKPSQRSFPTGHQGKLVPGLNQVSVHSLLVSKGESKVVELSEQIEMVKESLGIKTTKTEHTVDGKSTKDKDDSRSQSRDRLEEKERKPSVSKEGSKQDCSASSVSRVPRPVGKKAQEKCMSKFDKSEKYVKDIKMPRSSTPIDMKRTLNDLDPSAKKSKHDVASKKKGESEVKVSQTVLNITEMKIQNNAKGRDDNLSLSSSESGSVHYPGDKDFHKPDKYEVPANTLEVMMSHVNSPTDFYVHPISKVWGETLSLMSTGLKKQIDHLSSKKLKKMSKSFTPSVGDLCCAQFMQDNHYYRALITNIEMASPSKDTTGQDVESEHVGKVHLFYIDFGDKEVVPRRKVFPIPDEYRDIPGLAIHCSLAYVQPEPLEGGQWTKDAVEKFSKITMVEKRLKMLIMLGDITYTIDNHPKDVIKMPPVQVVLVDYEARGSKSESKEMEEICVNLELIRLGVASLIKDVSQSQEDSPLTPERLKVWDPMREAFLDNRNSYTIDTDDPGMATTGYKQGLTNICKFYQEGTCWRGEICPYRHVIETPGAVTMDQDLVYGNFDELIQDDILPDPGTWVACEVATILSPNHFYIVLPWGKKPLEVLEKERENTTDAVLIFLINLLITYSDFYEGSKYDGRLLHYAPGEMVSAPFTGDSQWYRARVVDTSESNIQVFYVDFGNKEWVHEQSLRSLEPQFLHLPFQAIECFLADIIPLNGQEHFSADAKRLYREMVDGITLVAFIRARSLAGCLYIELYDTRGDSDVSVGQSLIKLGVAEEGKDPTPSSPSTAGQISCTSSRSSSRESLILIPG